MSDGLVEGDAPGNEAEEFTELVGADFPRVDLVGKGANGLPFLIAKGQAGVLAPEVVRDLVSKADNQQQGTKGRDDVTISGSPAAVMKMIHEAALRASSNEKGAAMSEDVTKAEGDAPVEVGDLIPDAPGGSTADSVPGSPDWEERDAGVAESAIAVLGRARAAVEWLATREATEGVANGDGGDYENAFDLESVCCAIDCAIAQLGAFVAGEKVEAEVADEMDAITKAADGITVPLADLEPLAAVAKAGRVLSNANEQRIRNAADSLQQVLATLPAPVQDGDTGAVAKGQEGAAVEPTMETATDPVAKAADEADSSGDLAAVTEDVAKAKGDPVVIAYNSAGKAIGIIDPKNLMPIADDASAASSDDGSGDDAPAEADSAADGGDSADAAAPEADADAAAAPAPVSADQLAPQAPDAAGTPADEGDDVAKATGEPSNEAPSIEAVVKAAVEGVRSEYDQIVKSLQDRVDALEAPATPRVLANGVLPPAHLLRGQDAGAPTVDVAKADERRARLAVTTDVAEREQIMKEMNVDAAAALSALHQDARRR